MKICIFLTFLCISCAIYAQVPLQTIPAPKKAAANPADDFVIWDTRPGTCANSTCTMSFYDGVQYLSISHTGVTVIVGVEHDNKHYRAFVLVRNESINPVDVVPQRFKAIQTKPVSREIRMVPAQEIAKAIVRKAQWSKAFATFAAGMATTEQTTQTTESGTVQAVGTAGMATGTYSGSSTTTTTRPNTTLQRETARRTQAETAKAESVAQSIEIGELRANTIAPTQRISGDVYFERDKNAELLFLQIPIDGFTYNFPVLGPKNKQAR